MGESVCEDGGGGWRGACEGVNWVMCSGLRLVSKNDIKSLQVVGCS